MKYSSNFLTIGQLAKLSGIHIKALRYYESIDILKPSAINPDNGYRYYSHSHIVYVQVIKICAKYGLPLKDFKRFVFNNQQIDMAAILTKAQEKLTQQASELIENQAYLSSLQQQLELSHLIDQYPHQHLKEQVEDYLLFPFTGEMLSSYYYEAVQKSLSLIVNTNTVYANRVGCYYRYENDTWKQFLAIKVHDFQEKKLNENYLCLSKYHLHAHHLEAIHISRELDCLSKKKIKQVLILETFESPFQLHNPHLELRYVIK